MSSWMSMIAGGVIAVIGGILAVINPLSAAATATTIAGAALIVVAALQGWAAYKAKTNGARIRSGGIAAISGALGLSLLFGPWGSGLVLQWIVALLLLASGAAKLYAGYAMHDQNKPIVLGTGGVSAFLGLVVLFGLNLNFGTVIGVELLASGVGLVLLGMYRKQTQKHAKHA